MFAVADAEAPGFVVDLAVIVIAPPGGAVGGAEYVAAAPLAVWEVIPPQFEAPQLTDQSTPAAAGSLETAAVR